MFSSNEAVKYLFELTQSVSHKASLQAPLCDRLTLALPKPLFNAVLDDYEVKMRLGRGEQLIMGRVHVVCSYTDDVHAYAHYDQGIRKGDRVVLDVNLDPLRRLLAEANVAKS